MDHYWILVNSERKKTYHEYKQIMLVFECQTEWTLNCKKEHHCSSRLS